MEKGSKAAKAWGAKMKRLRSKSSEPKRRRKSTRKGQVRKTARRAYTKVKKRVKRRVNHSKDAWSF